MGSIWTGLQTAIWNILHRPRLADFFDILIVAVIIYELLMLTHQTRGSAVLKGLILLVGVTLISELFSLTALNWLMRLVLSNGVMVAIILFQPEFRKVLERMGRSSLFTIRRSRSLQDDEPARIVEEIVQMASDLSRRRVGALVVFERKTGLQDVIETGTPVDARITAPLLENIFEPDTPLHDGAVVIRDGRVNAAACILPLTDNQQISRELGTRHRAGIGVSETTDAIVLIVSEETGTVSVARSGSLARPVSESRLREILGEIYQPHDHSLLSIFHHHRAKEAG